MATIETQQNYLFFYDRALNSIGENHWKAAIDDLSVSIEMNPDFVPALVNRGNIYLETGDFPKAGADYERALHLAPDDAFARNNLGLVYLNSARDREAIDEFTRALSLDREYAEAYFNRALAFAGSGKIEEAIADLDRAASLFERQGDKDSAKNTREFRRKIGNL
ncbi:tetratricopeptide repeat protein [Pannus brasiliensis CCIBt3594]|uniref:Tetratricopeptide repeat protein n=1 Tax=Pannus brasiliensis CCIBt3594 TaxID=1427578 RepID=A0AAW9QM56_9CHRO